MVETPVNGSRTLTKNILVVNKGATNITYNTSIQNNPALTGGVFTLSTANFTVNAGTTFTVTVTFTGTGSTLKHAREGSVSATPAPVADGSGWLCRVYTDGRFADSPYRALRGAEAYLLDAFHHHRRCANGAKHRFVHD